MMDDFQLGDVDKDEERWMIKASEESKGIHHPLRRIVDGRKMPTNPDKELLTLSVGKDHVLLSIDILDERMALWGELVSL